MKRSFLFLLTFTACGPDQFTVIGPKDPPDAATDSRDVAPDSSDVDASEGGDSSPQETGTDAGVLDAKADGPCPTGTNACSDAITTYCSLLKTCCNGQCQYAWANAGGSQCAAQFNTGSCQGKMICENACLADLQSASCTTIKNGPSPAYIASSCMSLWQ